MFTVYLTTLNAAARVFNKLAFKLHVSLHDTSATNNFERPNTRVYLAFSF